MHTKKFHFFYAFILGEMEHFEILKLYFSNSFSDQLTIITRNHVMQIVVANQHHYIRFVTNPDTLTSHLVMPDVVMFAFVCFH